MHNPSINSSGNWLLPSLLALFFWGIWGFLTKVGAEKTPWTMVMMLFGIFTITGALICGAGKAHLDGYFWASAGAGLAGALGFLYFFNALSKGPATIVIPLTSMYVVISAILAFFFLAEPLTIKKVLGILFAVVAVIMMAV